MKGDYKKELWYMAKVGTLNTLPKMLLLEKNLMIKDYRGRTSFHYAAEYGNLQQLPKDSLTENAFTVKDKNRTTPLHLIFAMWIGVDMIPKEILISDNLLVKERVGYTPLEYLMMHGGLDLLLGVEFPDSVKDQVGPDWWDKNQCVISAKKTIKVVEPDSYDMEMF